MQTKTRKSAPIYVLGALVVLAAATARAHVTISPRESMQGAFERYTVTIPTEGEVATVAAELEAPEGVVIAGLQMPVGWTYEVTRSGGRIVSIRWDVNIKPHEFLEVGFVARNPRRGQQIVWTLRQMFADGTVRDWTTGPDGLLPTAITRLTPRPEQ